MKVGNLSILVLHIVTGYKITQPGRRINLGNVLSLPAIRGRYPHCIGLFQDASGKGQNWTPAYIESRVIQSEEELLEWIAQIERK